MLNAASQRRIPAADGVQSRPAFWRYALPLCIASPFALSLAFPKTSIAWLAFIALVPLFLLWAKASWKQALLSGWLAGAITFVLLFRWMIHSLGDFVGAWSWLALSLMSIIEGLSLAGVALVTSLVCRGRFRAGAVFAAP